MRYTCSSALLLVLLLVLPARLLAQPFTPNALGHIDDPAFKIFLKTNGIQLCGAFSVTHSLDSTIHFAVIFKNDQMQFLESTGKIYPTHGDYIKATGIEERIAKGFDTDSPFKRGDEDEYDEAEAPEWFQGNNTYTFEKRGKMGLVFNKKKILPAIYDDIRQDLAHGEPVFIITQNGLEGIADTNGHIVVEPAYTHISGLFSNGRICYHVKDGHSEGFLDIEGNFSIPLQELKLSYKGNYIRTSTGDYDRQYGMMDTLGNVMLEPVYTRLEPVSDYSSEGPAIHYNAIIIETEESGKGIIDFSGKQLLEPIYYSIDPSYRNVYRFSTAFGENGLSGFFDMATGKVVLPAEYTFEQDYGDENDTLPISKRTANGIRHGLITKKGELLVPVEYDYVRLLKNEGLLILANDGRYQITDMQLRPTHPETYEALSPLNDYGSDLPEHLLLAQKGRMEGVIDVKGKVIIPFRYNRIHPDNYVLRVVEGGVNDFMDLTGAILFTTDLTVLDCKIGYVYVKDENGARVLHDLYGNRLVNGKLKL